MSRSSKWPLSFSFFPVKFLLVYRSLATRVSQLKIWQFFFVTGIERNVRRFTFNRYCVITQFAKLAAGEQLCRRCTHRKLQHFKTLLKLSPEKSHILSCDNFVTIERCVFSPYLSMSLVCHLCLLVLVVLMYGY